MFIIFYFLLKIFGEIGLYRALRRSMDCMDFRGDLLTSRLKRGVNEFLTKTHHYIKLWILWWLQDYVAADWALWCLLWASWGPNTWLWLSACWLLVLARLRPRLSLPPPRLQRSAPRLDLATGNSWIFWTSGSGAF